MTATLLKFRAPPPPPPVTRRDTWLDAWSYGYRLGLLLVEMGLKAQADEIRKWRER